MPELLKELDFKYAAQELGCEIEVIKAVCQIEAPKGGFSQDGKPVILYEPYLFGDMTKHKYNSSFANIAGIMYPLSRNRRLLPWSIQNAKYGPSSIQHIKLNVAKALDARAAICSCSWGKFQILGNNYKLCGFTSPEDFVKAMYISETEHLKAFVNFIKNSRLDDELRNKDWERFAFQYNGPRQDKGTAEDRDDYDYFLKSAYDKIKKVA